MVNLPRNNLDDYLRIRTKLRCNYERLIIEESEFSLSNEFDKKLWEECYEKPIGWIETHIEQQEKHTRGILHLRSLRSLLISFLDEGTTLFQLLLRSLNDEKFTFNLSIYTAILLRKRENLSITSQEQSRAFSLLQEAITNDPFKGFGYFVMAQWTLKDKDPLLSIYWALTACNVKEPFPASFDFLKTVAKSLVISPSFLNVSTQFDTLNCQLLQMASHAIVNLMTGSSHLKHLDQLSHSQVSVKDCDVKSLKYSCIIIWLILGMFKQKSSEQVSPLQSCLLAKLFQVHSEFISEPEIRKVFLAFSSNSKYYKLFSGKNHEILKKINSLTFESLNNLLLKLIKIDRNILKLDREIYLDFVLYSINDEDEDNSNSLNAHSSFDIVNLFLKIELLSVLDDEIILKSQYEKIQQTERSIKLLTHQFLSTQVKTLESSIEPSHLPWTIPTYSILLRQFEKIKNSISNRECKIIVTLPVLQELDLDKTKFAECRDIIRYLNGLVESSNPYIQLLEAHGNNNTSEFVSYRRKLEIEHVKGVKYFYENVSKNVKIIIGNESESSYYFVPKPNLFKEL